MQDRSGLVLMLSGLVTCLGTDVAPILEITGSVPQQQLEAQFERNAWQHVALANIVSS